MTEPERLRAFVNGAAVEVTRGGTALDAVRAADSAAADEVAAGTRAVADSRGLVIDASTPVTGGAVFRVVSPKAKRAGDASA
ncbi:MAG: hypothetical protein NTX19_03385 [Gemmatimonadetes bacterium]|nr:hypothetical protein [Gemmatimonadota bacterium]